MNFVNRLFLIDFWNGLVVYQKMKKSRFLIESCYIKFDIVRSSAL